MRLSHLRRFHQFSLAVAFGAAVGVVSACSTVNVEERSEDTSFQSGLSPSAKQAMARYAYAVLDSHYSGGTAPDPQGVLPSNFPYDRLYITCYHGTRLRGSQSGASPREARDRLQRDIERGVHRCVDDRRFGGRIAEQQIPGTSLVLNFLRNRTRLARHDLRSLKQSVVLGIHAVRLRNGNRSVFFKESVPIAKNFSHKTMFERLCRKAKLPNTCYRHPKTAVYRYDTVTFRSDRAGNVVDLYRYDVLVSDHDLTTANIRERLERASNWFHKNVDAETERGKYIYYPSRDRYAQKQNHVCALATAWAMAKLQSFLGHTQLDTTLRATLAHYLSFRKEREGITHLEINGSSNLAYNAFMILILLNVPDYQDSTTLLRLFAQGSLSQQNRDGSFNTHFFSERASGVDFYPGEAMLALMHLYQRTGKEEYRSAVERGFTYYRTYWRSRKNTAFIPWHTQAYYLLFVETGNPEPAEFIFEMNDWLIEHHQIVASEYPDEIGGFPKRGPRFSTGVFLEGINDAYRVALALGDEVHANRYRRSIRSGARYLLQLQVTERNAFHMKRPDRAIGGFRRSVTRNVQRNDYTQHGVLALIKVLENNIAADPI